MTHRQAAELARLERVRIDALFADARQAAGLLAPLVEPSRDAVLAAARSFFHQLEASNRVDPTLDRRERGERLEKAIEDAGIVSADPADLQPVAKSVARKVGISAPPGSPAIAQLAQALHAAMVEHAGRQVERLEGVRVVERDPTFADIGPENAPLPRRMTLREAATAYGATPERRHLTERSHASTAQRLALWMELLGPEVAIADVTRDALRDAREVVMRLPAHAPKKWPKVPLRDVVRLAEREGVPAQAVKNAKNSITAVGALFAWAEREGHVQRSPAVGLGRIAQVGHREAPRRPFTVAELNILFASSSYQEPVWDLRQWAPLLALFGGFRSGEIIGLRRQDVEQVEEVWVLHVRPHAERRLKTRQSTRLVPIHPDLVQLGFLKWVASRPAGEPLFADRAVCLDATEKRLGRMIRAAFEDKRLVFHGLRHTFTDAMRAAGVPVEIAERLGGWKSAGSARLGYGDGFHARQLSAEIAKITYLKLVLPASFSKRDTKHLDKSENQLDELLASPVR